MATAATAAAQRRASGACGCARATRAGSMALGGSSFLAVTRRLSAACARASPTPHPSHLARLCLRRPPAVDSSTRSRDARVPRGQAGEKASPLLIEHALLDACRTKLRGVVSRLLVFGAPHAELGEIVGVACTLEARGGGAAGGASSVLTLKQLRAAGRKGGHLEAKWLPELLVLVDALPKGPTGKPKRIGLAEDLGLPTLSFAKPRLTVDQRAAAVAAAAASDATGAAGAGGVGGAPPPPPPPLDARACGAHRGRLRVARRVCDPRRGRRAPRP